MAYIIMAKDECGDECRWGPEFRTEAAAWRYLDENPAPEEWRRPWVEMLKDKAYYMEMRSDRGDGGIWDDRDDYDY